MMRFLAVPLLFLLSSAAQAEPRELKFEAFGDVAIYGTPGQAGRVAIILADKTVLPASRDGIGQMVAAQGGLAAVVDYDRYVEAIGRQPDACTYNSWEFEKLSKFVQKTVGSSRYEPPVLVGLGTGAALAYTIINEAPRGTFAGLFTAGLCLPFRLPKDLCANEGKTWSRTGKDSIGRLEPVDQATDTWVALPSAPPESCPASTGADFFGGIDGARILPASKADWGDAPWQADVSLTIVRMRSKLSVEPVSGSDLADLPLHEQRATAPIPVALRDTLAIIVTGDGGWAGFDRDLADSLAGAGVNVVGLNSLQYFWRQRTPDETAQALSRIIEHYTAQWQAKRVLLIGYSFGADVLPFAARRLPEDDLRRIAGVALLAPGFKADFEFRLGGWLGLDPNPKALAILPEIMAMPRIPTLCAYGAEEAESAETSCPAVPASRAKAFETKGGHHFDGNFVAMANAILGLLLP
ncbi:MAG: hypothetical protein K2P94_01760 [Rhodospirillaceae bacterium]|nr:hypothetical protein [Rhodospirillaceae bacterium]